jgi:hypothetical protein
LSRKAGRAANIRNPREPGIGEQTNLTESLTLASVAMFSSLGDHRNSPGLPTTSIGGSAQWSPDECRETPDSFADHG